MEAAMDWLLAHDSDPIPTSEESGQTTESGASEADPAKDKEATSSDVAPSEVKSLKCDDCGRLFKSQVEVEFHATKSGHSNFSESTLEKKPLTEEERQQQLAKVEEKLKAKRVERELKEKEEALERERLRIKSGKDLIEARRKIQGNLFFKLAKLR